MAHDMGQVGAQEVAHAHCQAASSVQALVLPGSICTAAELIQGLGGYMHLQKAQVS